MSKAVRQSIPKFRISKAVRQSALKFKLPLPPAYLLEESTGVLLEILFPEQKIEPHKKLTYQNEPRKASWKPDYYLPEKNLIVEWDGPDHYRDVWKIQRDKRHDQYCHEHGRALVRIPYWLQMQKGVADFLFDMQLTTEQEEAIAQRIYKVPNISGVSYSGLYDSANTPANFIEKGRERLRGELTRLPPIVLTSFKATIEAYIDRIGDVDCVVPPDLRDLFPV